VCGLTGIVFADKNRLVDQQLLRSIANRIAHRGPDAYGAFVQDGVGLAHLRLSIIDLAGGDQPMGNEDGTIQIVFNGEIYNYKDLRKKLISRGHRFRTASDTEVLVHLYEEFGPEFVHELRGMFAFALWDSVRERLVLGRDRIGQKPLYYYHDQEKLLFASELKAILAYPGIPRELNIEALDDYLAFGVVPGQQSIFANIRKLRPAEILVLDRLNWTTLPLNYWRLQAEPDHSRSEGQRVRDIREKLYETVDVHRVSDVPIGAFLSGGLDSSAVTTALASASNEQLTTFSIGFHEKEFSELEYARKIAKRCGTNHIEEIVSPEAAASLQDLVQYYDEPFADHSAIPTMHVARLASQHVKVVLSGDGGDEAFGGYSRYAHDLKEARIRRFLPWPLREYFLSPIARFWPKMDWLPRYLRFKTALTNLSLSDAQAYANTISIFRNPIRRRLFHPDIQESLSGYTPETQIWRGYGVPGRDVLKGMISADIHMLLPDDYLTKVDRASMAHGLEVRPPLVDHEFLELAAQIPTSMKVKSGQTKWIFKQMCRGWLPDDIIDRPKQGFEIPIDQWLRGPLRDVFEETVLSPGAYVSRYLDVELIRKLYHAHLRKTGNNGLMLWALLVLGAWMESYMYDPGSTPVGSHHLKTSKIVTH